MKSRIKDEKLLALNLKLSGWLMNGGIECTVYSSLTVLIFYTHSL